MKGNLILIFHLTVLTASVWLGAETGGLASQAGTLSNDPPIRSFVAAPSAPLSPRPLLPAALRARITGRSTPLPERAGVSSAPQPLVSDRLFGRVDLPFKYLQPIPLRGSRLGSLPPKAIEVLGLNHFVVINNTGAISMEAVYRENRLSGKTNFVTADSIMHPYLAFSNRVLAQAIEEHMAQELASLARAMIDACLSDYAQADDMDVRNDIEHNIAFLAVAMKLIEPGAAVHMPDTSRRMVEADLSAIERGSITRSAIFDRQVDFDSFRPWGWYESSALLKQFFQARQWVSSASYPIADTTGSTAGSGNSFRRSILLYRALVRGAVGDEPAVAVWQRLNRGWALLGSPSAIWLETALTPGDYRKVFPASIDRLEDTLGHLAEPFFRTKLFMCVRKHRPLKLGSTSILEMQGATSAGQPLATFHLFPAVSDPELPWLRTVSAYSGGRPERGSAIPIALLVLKARGSAQASNVLYESAYKIDPHITSLFPPLVRLVNTESAGRLKPVDHRIWKLVSGYFQVMPEGTQDALRTMMWHSRRLESAFAAWLDSHLTIAPDPVQTSVANTAQQIAAPRTIFYHTLEPASAIYRAICEDAEALRRELKALGYYPSRLDPVLSDFIRLAARLEKMSQRQLSGARLTVADLSLLANIDLVLEKVKTDLPDSLALNPPGAYGTTSGVNLALGDSGRVYVILQYGDKVRLARGALYTYYEVPRHVAAAGNSRKQLDLRGVQPPFWVREFDYLVSGSRAPNAKARGPERSSLSLP